MVNQQQFMFKVVAVRSMDLLRSFVEVVLHGDGTLNEPLNLAPYEGAFFLAGL